MVDHVAHLARLDVATEAAQKLVGAPCRLVDHEGLREAHVAGVRAEPVPDAPLDNGPPETTIHCKTTKVFVRHTCHWQAYIGWLSHCAAVSHEVNVLVHRGDRCLLHDRNHGLLRRHLHHRCGKATAIKGCCNLLVLVELLGCCWYERWAVHDFINQAWFVLILTFQLDRDFWFRLISIGFELGIGVSHGAHLLRNTRQAYAEIVAGLSHDCLVHGTQVWTGWRWLGAEIRC